MKIFKQKKEIYPVNIIKNTRLHLEREITVLAARSGLPSYTTVFLECRREGEGYFQQYVSSVIFVVSTYQFVHVTVDYRD